MQLNIIIKRFHKLLIGAFDVDDQAASAVYHVHRINIFFAINHKGGHSGQFCSIAKISQNCLIGTLVIVLLNNTKLSAVALQNSCLSGQNIKFLLFFLDMV
jgi:hypothetical protein